MATVRRNSRMSSVSRPSTVVTTPLPALNRFDILLMEQVSLVKNAQEGLRQALVVLNKASSAEEKKSSKLQVQSLMSRAQELVTVLQAVLKVREELTNAQKDLVEAKQTKTVHQSHYQRVHWLEQRLERLLMARRRGRPAVRVQRQAHTKGAGEDNGIRSNQRQGFTQSRPVPLRRTNASPECIASSPFDSPILPTSSAPTSQSAQVDFTIHPSTVHGESPFSSRPSASKESRDSDVWHSESEANWTIQLSNVNPTKDITHSQVLSSADEVTPSRLCSTTPTVPSCAMTREVCNHVQCPVQQSQNYCPKKPMCEETFETLYGFEVPRPADLFGACSWNTLALAVNTNFLENISESRQSYFRNPMKMGIELDQLCKELLTLKNLIVTASAAATVEGILLPIVSHMQQLDPTEVQESQCLLNQQQFIESTEIILPTPPSCKPRKVYNKEGGIVAFPRRASAWSPSKEVSLPLIKQNRSQSVSHVTGSSYIIRSSVKKARSKSLCASSTKEGKCDVNGKVEDIFDVERLRKQRINFLLQDLNSTCVETRRSSVQALGALESSTFQIQHQLTELLHDHDSTVRYSTLKSSLSLGVTSDYIKQMTGEILLKGSPSVQLDLLKVIKNAQTKHPHFQCKWCQVHLTILLSSDSPELTLLAAVVLSHCRLEKKGCLMTLSAHLSSSNQAWRDQALHCLIRDWSYAPVEVLNAAISQLRSCINWKIRLSLVQLLIRVEKEKLLLCEELFDVLLQAIVREPIQIVKDALGVLLTNLGMEKRAQKILLGRLENSDEAIRAEAAIALRAFELKSPKEAQMMMDYFEVDPSSYVRIQLVKTLSMLKCYSPDIMGRLSDKCKGGGNVARECRAVFIVLRKRFGLLDEGQE